MNNDSIYYYYTTTSTSTSTVVVDNNRGEQHTVCVVSSLYCIVYTSIVETNCVMMCTTLCPFGFISPRERIYSNSLLIM